MTVERKNPDPLPAAEGPSDADIQVDLSRSVRAYVERVRDGDALSPFPPEDGVAPTDVLIAVTGMLEAVDVEVFELALWQTWGKP